MARGQQFHLRWNNHVTNILSLFNEHYEAESLVDVTLSCEGKFLKVHKLVLSSCSPYFREIFRHHLHQVPNPVVIMNGMKFEDIKLVIDFMYKGEIKVLESDLNRVLAAAEVLQVKGLSNVRTSYEDNLQDNKAVSVNKSQEPHQTPLFLKRKRVSTTTEEVVDTSSISHHPEHTSKPSTSNGQPMVSPTPHTDVPKPFVPPTSQPISEDDDLPTSIKVELPDIRDIDEEPAGWESPKLVIDMAPDQQQRKGAQEERVTKRMVVNSVIVKRGRGRPRKIQSDEDEVMEQRKTFQGPKGVLKMKTMSLKKMVAANPQWRKRTGKIPRPPNAFMIFANEYRRKLAFDNPSENNKEISCRLGSMWKNLPPEVKETYYTQSREADEEHKRKYPGYYYSPKEARLRKNLKADQAEARRGPKHMDANYLVNVVMPDNDESDEEPIPPPYLLFQGNEESLRQQTFQNHLLPMMKPPTRITPKVNKEVMDDCQPSELVQVKMEEEDPNPNHCPSDQPNVT